MGYNRVVRVATTKVYLDWINSLNDRAGRARIQVRVDRLVHGNPGQHRALTDGVYELKIDSLKEVAYFLLGTTTGRGRTGAGIQQTGRAGRAARCPGARHGRGRRQTSRSHSALRRARARPILPIRRQLDLSHRRCARFHKSANNDDQ